ncbi:MAG TPA: VCBS repeat-containing protein [Pirellulales bacterium]|nr:VCBS repeat-containing protein [Pirellulales bacterium]
MSVTWTLLVLAVAAAPPPDIPWAGEGRLRVLLEVDSAGNNESQPQPAREASARTDERPADVRIEFATLLAGQGIEDQVVDPASIQVIRHEAATGAPERTGLFAFARGEFEIPSRWYDATIPYEFPECNINLATSQGRLPRTKETRTGYFYECVGEGRDGHLAFVHRDDGKPAIYGLYFDTIPADKLPDRQPPRGFVGDGSHRCEPIGHSTTGLIHSRIDVVDFNGDKLPDLLVGCSRGSIVWYPNVGRADDWKFTCSRLLATRDGEPIDVGYGSTPHVCDFDADGKLDLLVGGERNRVVWYRNVGTATAPALEYQGLVEAEGEPLELPVKPCPEGPDIFTLDYYPVLETADWDGDGDQDLLAGGYVTGRIYWYENTAGPGAPWQLHLAGELSADGEPLDVGWAAAPGVADVDGDGDLDLFTGCMLMTAGGGDSISDKKFLWFFENVGTPREPRLHARSMPHRGDFPVAAMATPRLVDFTGDGLADIIASSGERIYFFRNVGTRTEPIFEAHRDWMPGVWNNAPLAGTQFFDYDGDGRLDGVDGPRVYRNTGRGSPGIFASPISLLQPGQKIDHLSGIGDDWTFQRLYDLDDDGTFDLLDADHAGHIWWHRNRGTAKACDFDTTGVRLNLADGTPLTVGGKRTGFDALQGARATYTAGDFDGDGHADLVTTDTFGDVVYFQQAPRGGADTKVPTFEPGKKIAKLRIRGVPTACDWNGDGRLDIVAGSSAADVVVILGKRAGDVATREGATFDEPAPIKLPPAPDGAGAPLVVTDFNGDGDLDIILHTAYAYTCFYERSFIDRGYARGHVVALQTKPK